MGVLKSAFNAICRIHSQEAFIKRPGSPDVYSPMRIAVSNYFRYLAGPSQTIVSGSEGIIAASTIYGQQQIAALVDAAPTSGTWTISFYLNGTLVTTGDLDFDADHTDIQSALRLITGCENVIASGDLQSLTLTVQFIGVKQVANLSIDFSLLVGTTSATYTYTPITWASPLVKRGDRILIGTGVFTATEIIPMPDIGGEIIGYRVRYE